MKYTLCLFASLAIFSGSYAQSILAEHHFESDGITHVTIIGSFCDVYITKGDQVVFDGIIEGDGDPDDYLIASIRNGSNVVFKVERKRDKSWSWKNWNEMRKAQFELKIPDNVEIRLENSSGDVKIVGLSGTSYEIQTTSGDLDISDLIGVLTAKCTSGDSDFSNITGNIIMRSTSGDQEFRDIMGSVRTEATSGDVDVRGLKGNLYIKATSGDLEVDNVEGAIALSTTSGDIEGNRVLLNGDSQVKATSGDVSIDFLNDLEEIGFSLEATSGNLAVGSIDSDDHLVLRRGDVTFEGRTTSGDQTYNN